MSLFDESERAETRPRRQNEGEFAYMNASARPGFGMIRELLERWFDQLPRAAQADIRARFRSCDKAQHQSAFFEQYWHELLRVSGNDIEIHPVLPDAATNPDFLVLRNHAPQFYFEVTLAMPPGDPEVEFRGSPAGNLRGRVIRERLERWVRSLNHAEIAQMYQDQTYDSVPSLTWSEQGCTLTFSPIPKGLQFRGQPGARPVGIVMPAEMRDLHTHDDIRAAIDGKGSKYGNLGLPLVVAVNVLDDFCDDDDIWNALFGEEQITVTREPGGNFRHDWGPRVPNGTWRGRDGARNRLVSAVSIVHQLGPSTLRSRSVELIHNPWAANPLPLDALPLAQIAISVPDGQIQRHDARHHADILGIPQTWPVQD